MTERGGERRREGERGGEMEPEFWEGEGKFVQFQQELFVPFQTGVTWQWQALTNNQRQ